mgnify:CR=1 FL=1
MTKERRKKLKHVKQRELKEKYMKIAREGEKSQRFTPMCKWKCAKIVARLFTRWVKKTIGRTIVIEGS